MTQLNSSAQPVFRMKNGTESSEAVFGTYYFSFHEDFDRVSAMFGEIAFYSFFILLSCYKSMQKNKAAECLAGVSIAHPTRTGMVHNVY